MNLSKLFLFLYVIIRSCTKHAECQTNDSPIEYNCKIIRQKTALADTLNTHTRAVSSADGVQCLACHCLLVL